MTEDEARDILIKDVNYFGVMLVYMSLVDGMVSGANHLLRQLFAQLKSLKLVRMLAVLLVPSLWFVALNVTSLVTVPSISILMLKL